MRYADDLELSNRFVAIGVIVSWVIIIGGGILLANWIYQ